MNQLDNVIESFELELSHINEQFKQEMFWMKNTFDQLMDHPSTMLFNRIKEEADSLQKLHIRRQSYIDVLATLKK